jgi:hypothetical protein
MNCPYVAISLYSKPTLPSMWVIQFAILGARWGYRILLVLQVILGNKFLA